VADVTDAMLEEFGWQIEELGASAAIASSACGRLI
jgi:hypothetical protein